LRFPIYAGLVLLDDDFGVVGGAGEEEPVDPGGLVNDTPVVAGVGALVVGPAGVEGVVVELFGLVGDVVDVDDLVGLVVEGDGNAVAAGG